MVFAVLQSPNAPHLPFLLLRHPQLPTAPIEQQPTPQIVHESNTPPRETVMIWRSQQEKESLEFPPALYSEQHFAPNSRRNLTTHHYSTMPVLTSNQYNQVAHDELVQNLATNSPQPQHAPHRPFAHICPTHTSWELCTSVYYCLCCRSLQNNKDTTRSKKKNLQTTANPKPCLLLVNITSDTDSKYLIYCYKTQNTWFCAKNITNNHLPRPHDKSSYFLQFLRSQLAFSLLSSNWSINRSNFDVPTMKC